jgi:hypothetical protein
MGPKEKGKGGTVYQDACSTKPPQSRKHPGVSLTKQRHLTGFAWITCA